jgi:hypothetical protein
MTKRFSVVRSACVPVLLLLGSFVSIARPGAASGILACDGVVAAEQQPCKGTSACVDCVEWKPGDLQPGDPTPAPRCTLGVLYTDYTNYFCTTSSMGFNDGVCTNVEIPCSSTITLCLAGPAEPSAKCLRGNTPGVCLFLPGWETSCRRCRLLAFGEHHWIVRQECRVPNP